MKQDVIRIQATILIPYNPQTWGDTHRAEQLAGELMADVQNADGVTLDVWKAKKTRVGVE